MTNYPTFPLYHQPRKKGVFPIIHPSVWILWTWFGAMSEDSRTWLVIIPHFTLTRLMIMLLIFAFLIRKEAIWIYERFNLICFNRNLEKIGGRDKAEFFSALYIVKTSLRSLNLRSLKRIRSGTVAILENPDLCYAKSINWRRILTSKAEEQIFNNQAEEKCRRAGEVCSAQCSSDGCWGKETKDCLSCAKYKLDDQCIPSCNAEVGYGFTKILKF